MLLSLLEVLSGEKLVSSVFCAVVPDVKNEILLCSPAFVKLSFCEYMWCAATLPCPLFHWRLAVCKNKKFPISIQFSRSLSMSSAAFHRGTLLLSLFSQLKKERAWRDCTTYPTCKPHCGFWKTKGWAFCFSDKCSLFQQLASVPLSWVISAGQLFELVQCCPECPKTPKFFTAVVAKIEPCLHLRTVYFPSPADFQFDVQCSWSNLTLQLLFHR